jgi:hypothetical protein
MFPFPFGQEKRLHAREQPHLILNLPSGDLGSSASRGQATTSDDARYPGRVRVEYPLHRLFGKQFDVVSRIRYGSQWHYVLDLGHQRLCVPRWMTDPVYCGELTWGLDPVCSLTSHFHVLALLDSRACRSVSTKASSNTG